MLSPDIRNKSVISILMIPIQHCTGSSTQYNKAKRETKGIQNGKEEVKPFLFSDNIIIYVGIIWHHRLNGHEFEQTPGDSEGQGSLACYSPCGRKESDTTEKMTNNKVCATAVKIFLICFMHLKSILKPNKKSMLLLKQY